MATAVQMEVSSRSRVLAVIGDPIQHSLSPRMHNAAIAASGLDAVYVAFHVEAVSLPQVLRAFEALGVAGNVTVPHKVAVSSLLIRVTGIAKDVGAVNTFWPENGRLIGDNTDVQGVLDTVTSLDVDGPWLILGTGGAARAAVIAARERAVPVRIRSRQDSRASDLAEWARQRGVSDAAADDGNLDFGVAINATPVGMGGDHRLPMPRELVERCAAGFDMVYESTPTPFVELFLSQHKTAVDGRAMLVAQGVYAFERFFPDIQAPREVMRAAVNRWIGQRS
jgi:shikimate dehydrogenase